MSTGRLILEIVERCLLSIVLAFLAAVVVGASLGAGTPEHPRTVPFYSADAHGASQAP